MTGRGARASAAVGTAAGGRPGLGLQLLKAVRILPGHPLNEDLPSWSFSVAGDFSKSTTCFSRSPEQKSLFAGMKSTAEILPSVPPAFKGISVSSPPLTPCYCSKPSSRGPFLRALTFWVLYLFLACHLLCSGKFLQSHWTTTLLFPPPPHLPLIPPNPPLIKVQFQVSSLDYPHSLVPFMCLLLLC